MACHPRGQLPAAPGGSRQSQKPRSYPGPRPASAPPPCPRSSRACGMVGAKTNNAPWLVTPPGLWPGQGPRPRGPAPRPSAGLLARCLSPDSPTAAQIWRSRGLDWGASLSKGHTPHATRHQVRHLPPVRSSCAPPLLPTPTERPPYLNESCAPQITFPRPFSSSDWTPASVPP